MMVYFGIFCGNIVDSMLDVIFGFFSVFFFFCDGDVVCVVVSRWDVYILVVFSVYDIIVFFNKVVGMRRRIIVVVLVVVCRRKRWLL